MEDKKVDIVIADDHKLFRKGIYALLSDFEFINEQYEAGDGEALLVLLKGLEKKPDLILLDLQMPRMDGIKANSIIRELFPEIKVIILTMEDDAQIILHMIREGVNGYLMKSAEPEELEKAILHVMHKDYYFPDDISMLIIDNMRSGKNSTIAGSHGLTTRELQTLKLICKEYTAAEIANELNLSVRTVEGYRSQLLEKTGSKNIAGLVVYALTNGLVEVQ